MGIIRGLIGFVRETKFYIILGMLIVSVGYNYKLIERSNTKTIDVMPYSHKIEGSKDGIIRDARPSVKQDSYRMQEF